MQLSFKRKGKAAGCIMRLPAATLKELREGEQGVLERLDVPEDVARRLMELGFLPGHVVTRGRSAPGGDPRVFRVDGSEVALRGETAACLILRAEPPSSCAEPPVSKDLAQNGGRREIVPSRPGSSTARSGAYRATACLRARLGMGRPGSARHTLCASC
ncbi:MAG: FeoA domain-containing protein [Bryobacteraceae bacterium]